MLQSMFTTLMKNNLYENNLMKRMISEAVKDADKRSYCCRR